MISVVVVDDEYIIRRGLIKIICENMESFNVVADCENGQDCLQFLSRNKVDLIICDVRMPILNGIELLNEVRENGLDTDFIFVSGYDDFEYCKAAIQGNAFDYLLKPVDKTDFICALRKYEQKKDNAGGEEISCKKIIREIKQYLQKHVNERITVEMVADRFNISPNYLSHSFKVETGITLTQYINNLKIEMACIYLKDQTKRVNEIADILGYSSAQMFANAFKKTKGVTPSEYRAKQ